MMTTLDPDVIKVLFGQHLARVRREKKMSQEGLALESGLARSYLGGVERGKRNIALVNICKLAEALNVSPAELMRFGIGSESSG